MTAEIDDHVTQWSNLREIGNNFNAEFRDAGGETRIFTAIRAIQKINRSNQFQPWDRPRMKTANEGFPHSASRSDNYNMLHLFTVDFLEFALISV